ncbi:MAG: UDP-N-acetylmuramoyl-L-alanine--D-glutamate ligase [Treponema sp.]|jgi:UDP-N-acetylmuramoylalanine--D-glutamate ligase|nr:UDP-N-acetylmuramoyl-L-alanine--D-glutamate ligase [Treponema sp.]
MDYTGKKVLVMGLGLHGGGLASAYFLLKRGAKVTVTDLRDEKTLLPSIEQLDAACRELGCEEVRYVLGRHETEDFKTCDFVIKNPGVKQSSPFLQAAKQIETDISLFLSESPARLFAVTGSKGKSCTASALHWILNHTRNTGKTFLGGNITVSPLTFIDELTEDNDVVLELSSWQLGDLKGRVLEDAGPLLKPKAAILTAIMPDHLDHYSSMEEYVNDKRIIYQGQDSSGVTVAGDDDWGKSFRSETKARPLVYSRSPLQAGISGGWLEGGSGYARLCSWDCQTEETGCLVPDRLLTPGEHQKMNLLSAALAAYSLGVKAQDIRDALAVFPGIEHRLEFFHEADGTRFYNDSAATIPQAAAACIEALSPQGPLVLVTGGTDKNLDFSPLVNAAHKIGSSCMSGALILLAGTGSEKLAKLLGEAGIAYNGPFDNLEKAALCAFEKAKNIRSAKGKCSAALSPGCASFGMFLNEFDRGRRWKETVLRITQ